MKDVYSQGQVLIVSPRILSAAISDRQKKIKFSADIEVIKWI